MKYLSMFIIGFILIYLFYLLTVILQKKRIDKFKKSNQVMFFINRYHLDIDKINIKHFIQLISLTNSFIIAISFSASFLVDNIYLGLLIGLLVLIPFMLLCYHLIGKHYQKKEVKK